MYLHKKIHNDSSSHDIGLLEERVQRVFLGNYPRSNQGQHRSQRRAHLNKAFEHVWFECCSLFDSHRLILNCLAGEEDGNREPGESEMDGQGEKTRHASVVPDEWDGPSKKVLYIAFLDILQHAADNFIWLITKLQVLSQRKVSCIADIRQMSKKCACHIIS